MSRRAVYVAGASAERDLVSKYMRALEAGGWQVTHDWPAEIARRGGRANEGLTDAEAVDAITGCVAGVDRASVLWLLAPSEPSAGCWFELGYAFGSAVRSCNGGPRIIVSGRHGSVCTFLPTIERYAHHDAALESLLAEVRA